MVGKKFINRKKHGFAIPNDLIFNKKNTDYFYSLDNRFNLNTDYLRKLFDLNMNNEINLKNSHPLESIITTNIWSAPDNCVGVFKYTGSDGTPVDTT